MSSSNQQSCLFKPSDKLLQIFIIATDYKVSDIFTTAKLHINFDISQLIEKNLRRMFAICDFKRF